MHPIHPLQPFNDPTLIQPTYMKNVRLISDKFLFNNVINCNVLTVVPTKGIGVNTTTPRAAVDVIGGIITSSNVGIGLTQPVSLLSVFGGATIGNMYSNIIAPSQGLAVVGNIGIGTTLPASKLSVSGGVAIGSAYTATTAPANGLIVVGNIGVGTVSPASKLSISGGVGIGSSYTSVSAPTDSLIVAGNIGIGNTQPLSKLSVNGGVGIGYTSVPAPNNGLIVSGNIGVGTVAPAARVSVNGGVGIGAPYTANTAPVDGLMVAGSVGIGTTNPASKLSIHGNVAVGAAYTAIPPPIDGLIVVGSVGIGTTNPAAKVSIGGGVGIGATYTSITAPIDGVIIAGNVGVGLTNPGSRLSIDGGVAIGTYCTSNAPINGVIVSGNIGIGTLLAPSKLTVNGGATFGSTFSNITAPTDSVIVSRHLGIGVTQPGASLSVAGGAGIGYTYANSNVATNRLLVEGSLGVGTNAPGSTAAISGSVSIGQSYASNSAPQNGLIVYGSVGIGTVSPGSKLSVSDGLSVGTLYTALTAPSNSVIVSGNIGVGTAAPASKLSVSGGVSIGQPYESFIAPDEGLIVVGNIGVGTNVPHSKLSVSGGVGIGASYTSRTAPDNGLIVQGNVGFGITTPGSKLSILGGVSIGSNYANVAADAGVMILEGNLGVGTSNPLATIHSKGDVFIEGNMVCSSTMTTSNLNVIGSLSTINAYVYQSSNMHIENANGFGPALYVAQTGVGMDYPIADFYDTDKSTVIPRFRIADGGNVGIHTNIPLQPFDCWGNIAVKGITVVDADTNITASTVTAIQGLFGEIMTPNQPFISTLSGATSVGSNDITVLKGTLATSSQPNIVYLGSTSNIGIGSTFVSSAKINIGGNVAVNGVTVIQNAASKMSVIADDLTGKVLTINQPDIETLSGVKSIGANSNTTITGTVITPKQSGIRYLTGGNIGISTDIAGDTLDVWGNIAVGGVRVIDSELNIVATNLTVSGLITGNLATGSLPNVTSLPGVLSFGSNDSTSITGTLTTALQPNVKYVAASGRFGVGTSNPSLLAKMDVFGNIAVNGAVVIDTNNNLYGNVATSSQPGITTLSNVTYVGASASTSIVGTVNTDTQPNIRYLGTTANIGIGTQAAAQKLDVWGNVAVNGVTVLDTNRQIYCSNIIATDSVFANKLTINEIQGIIISPYQQQITRIGILEALQVGTVQAPANMLVTGKGYVNDTLECQDLIVKGNITSSSGASSGTSFGSITVSSTSTTCNLSVTGPTTSISSYTTITSNVIINNTGAGPALSITQTGINTIADFFRQGENIPVMRIGYNGNVGIGSATPRGTLDIGSNGVLYASNITLGGIITASNLIINGSSPYITTITASNSFVLACNVESVMSMSTSNVPSSRVLSDVANNIARQAFVNNVVINSVTETSTGTGYYNVSCSAIGNAPSYSWSLSNSSGGQIASPVSGPSSYTFSNQSFTAGANSIRAFADTTTLGSGTGTGSYSALYTFTANTVETVAAPSVTINSGTVTASTISVDSVNYYTGAQSISFATNALTFAGLKKVYAYSGANFLTISNTNFNWSDVFLTNPTSEASFNNTKALSSITVNSSNVQFTVRNVLSSTTIIRSIAYLPSAISPVFTNTNPFISSVSRTYLNGSSLGSTDVIFAPIKNVFVTSTANAGTFDFKPTTTATSGRTLLYINVTPVSGIAVVSFAVTHNSANVSNIEVQWSEENATYYSATVSFINGGCGAGAQSGFTWYIRRPTSISQVSVSSIKMVITYTGTDDIPIPSIS